MKLASDICFKLLLGQIWNTQRRCGPLTLRRTLIENVQRRATKQVPSLKQLSYTDRLKKLKMPTLKYRRIRGDMIETFKIVNGIYDRDETERYFEISRSDQTR